MFKTAYSLTTLVLIAVFTAMFGITACTDVIAPRHDCPITNGPNICKPS